MQRYTDGAICTSDEQRRDALSDVWMTRTRSAFDRIYVALLSLRTATLALGAASAESRAPCDRSWSHGWEIL